MTDQPLIAHWQCCIIIAYVSADPSHQGCKMFEKLEPALLKFPSLAFLFSGLLVANAEDALADITLFTLSTDSAYSLSQQEVSVDISGDILTLGIDWKMTSPLIFSLDLNDRYVTFFKALVSDWDAYARDLDASGSNTAPLGYLPTQSGELSVVFFARLADGREFADGASRVRMVYCGQTDGNCIAGQVHFYTRGQISQLVDLLSNP